MLSLEEAFAWAEGLANLEKTPDPSRRAYRLDRMQALLEHFGQPQLRYQTLHVAGSKGKGSTSQFLARSLQRNTGLKVGLYTSPHLVSYRERVMIDGDWAGQDELWLEALTDLRGFAEGPEAAGRLEAWGGPPTTFEVLTAAAFLMFARAGCQVAVIEVGLGGRLDATNVLQPHACLITPIELEHTEILGTTLTAIAGEKAGILHSRVPVFFAPQKPEAEAALAAAAERTGAPAVWLARRLERLKTAVDSTGTRVLGRWQNGPDFDFTLQALGVVQAENALLAALVLEQTFQIPPPATFAAVADWTIPGRLEFWSRQPLVVLDGAHTAVSAARLAETWQALAGSGGILLFGAFPAKDIGSMAAALGPLFSTVVVTRPGTFRPSDPLAAAALFRAHCPSEPVIEPDTAKAFASALDLARQSGRPLLVTGSFYLVGEVKKLARA